jgi:3-oxoacyl-[acyl-carrier-protein] synthase II
VTPRVVITGFGAVTPVGNDAESTWTSLKEGRSGVGPITTFDASTYPVQIGGMVDGFELEPRLPDQRLGRYLSRSAGFGVAAALEALHNAGLDGDIPYDPEERGVAMGSSVGRPPLQEVADIGYVRASSEGRELLCQAPADVVIRDQNVGAATMAAIADCRGPIIGISTACTASIHSAGEAFRRIQEGEARFMLAGGYESLTTWLDVLGFSLLGALTKEYNDDPEHASRPFDRDRSGFVVAEGGVVLVLEELEAARARGAPILAELAGYGSSMNAYRMTDPPPDGRPPALAIEAAMREAKLTPADIDYVVSHGTSTPTGDISETVAIKRAFGEDAKRIVVSSVKSMTGHLTAGAGALNLLAATYAMRDAAVSPTINYDNPDPECDLDYVPNEAREMEVRAATANAFAFGGTNACIALRRPDLIAA